MRTLDEKCESYLVVERWAVISRPWRLVAGAGEAGLGLVVCLLLARVRAVLAETSFGLDVLGCMATVLKSGYVLDTHFECLRGVVNIQHDLADSYT
jgi:hypothetical protein